MRNKMTIEFSMNRTLRLQDAWTAEDNKGVKRSRNVLLWIELDPVTLWNEIHKERIFIIPSEELPGMKNGSLAKPSYGIQQRATVRLERDAYRLLHDVIKRIRPDLYQENLSRRNKHQANRKLAKYKWKLNHNDKRKQTPEEILKSLAMSKRKSKEQ